MDAELLLRSVLPALPEVGLLVVEELGLALAEAPPSEPEAEPAPAAPDAASEDEGVDEVAEP